MSLQSIIENAQEYTTKLNEANKNRKTWPQVSKVIYDRLQHIKAAIEREVPYFSKNLFVKRNGVKDSVSLYAGMLPYPGGNEQEYGFAIVFFASATGKLKVMLQHHIIGDHTAKSEELLHLDNPLHIDENTIDDIVNTGISKAKESSYLFI